jgi:hypothetical protein
MKLKKKKVNTAAKRNFQKKVAAAAKLRRINFLWFLPRLLLVGAISGYTYALLSKLKPDDPIFVAPPPQMPIHVPHNKKIANLVQELKNTKDMHDKKNIIIQLLRLYDEWLPYPMFVARRRDSGIELDENLLL